MKYKKLIGSFTSGIIVALLMVLCSAIASADFNSSSYKYLRVINCTFMEPGQPGGINETIQGTDYTIWTRCDDEESLNMFYNTAEDIIIYNTTTQKNIEVEKGIIASINPTNIWDTNTIGVYHMNQTNQKDSTQYGFDCSAVGSPTVVPGVWGDGLDFVANGQYLTCDSGSNWGAVDYSIEVYFNADIANTRRLVVKRDVGTGPEWIWFTNSHLFQGSAWRISNTGKVIDIWYFGSGARTSGTIAIYNNGVNDDASGGAGSGDVSNADNLTMAFGPQDGGGLSFDGTIDEVRIYNNSRSALWFNASYKNRLGITGYMSLGAEGINPDWEVKTYPVILNNTYNCTSCILGDELVWRTDTNNIARTFDPSPTVLFSTENLTYFCAISLKNLPFSGMTADDPNTNCSVSHTTDWTCTLPTSQALPFGTSKFYIGCVDETLAELNTSTSGDPFIRLIQEGSCTQRIEVLWFNNTHIQYERTVTVTNVQGSEDTFTIPSLLPDWTLTEGASAMIVQDYSANETVYQNLSIRPLGADDWINVTGFNTTGAVAECNPVTMILPIDPPSKIGPSAPNVTLISPPNGTSITFANSRDLTLNSTVTGTASTYDNCTLFVNSSAVETINNVANATNPIPFSALNLSSGSYDWRVDCVDVNLTGSSETWEFVIEKGLVSVEMCHFMSGAFFFTPNISNFNMTTNTLTEFDTSPDNESQCGYTYNITLEENGSIEAKINATFDATHEYEINNTNVSSTSWITIITGGIAGIVYEVDTLFSWNNATDSPEDWEADFR